MLKKPYIKPSIQEHIRVKLNEIEQAHQIKIIHAIESGSRAWGFPSIDSDYDVRFIYVRLIKDYLSMRNYTDHIETPIVFDEILGAPFDLNGWDLRKALKLSIKSNPVLVEWLVSPICYINDQSSTDLLNFTKEVANLDSFLYHYDRLARSSWNQILQDPNNVKTKLYCYALRPVIAMRWILQKHTTPPMDMMTLCNGCINDDILYAEIISLIERKSNVKEGDLIPRNIILDGFIESSLEHEANRIVPEADAGTCIIEMADKIFFKISQYNNLK